jgi:hypothetical protein
MLTFRASTAVVAAAFVGVCAPLLTAGSAQSATATTGSATINITKATAGEKLTFSGRVSGGSRPVYSYRVYAGKLVTKVAGTSNADGTFSITRRMAGMPLEYYKVVAPATRTSAAWTSTKFTVQNQMQDVNLTRSGTTFTAQLTFTTSNLDGSNQQTRNAGAGRAVVLQHQGADRTWTAVPGQSGTTNSTGAVVFSVPGASGTYRALAGQTADGVSAFASFPVRTTPAPTLTQVNVYDPAGTKLSPMPASGNGAAAKYDWWPATGFWDTALGEGMSGPAGQGCTDNCTPWSDYATGTGRVAINDGQIALDTGYPSRSLPVWGDLSSTLGIDGYADGRWEMRVHHNEMVPGHTPYTSRVSLVPAGTPDGTVPAKRIVLAEWTGYDDKTQLALGQGGGDPVLTRTVTGIQYGPRNWHDLAVQITSGKIVWLIDGNVVGQADGAATTGTKWVPRIEMLSTPGRWMDRARGGIDWVRYFPLADKNAKTLPQAPSLQ